MTKVITGMVYDKALDRRKTSSKLIHTFYMISNHARIQVIEISKDVPTHDDVSISGGVVTPPELQPPEKKETR